jgi:hypothetical protein
MGLAGSNGLATGDLTNDGRQDVFSCGFDSLPRVFIGHGDGGDWALITTGEAAASEFVAFEAAAAAGGPCRDAAIADITNDGHTDIVLSRERSG